MNKKHQDDLSHIRSMMERSSRFISLSGLSGVSAGLAALLGGIYVYRLFQQNGIAYFDGVDKEFPVHLVNQLIAVGIAILIVALVSAVFFTVQKSKQHNLPIWTSATKNMLFHLAIPVVVGAIFGVALLLHQLYVLLAPVTLLFYGLALINAGSYTLTDVKYLGFTQLILGCLSLFLPGYGLVFWILGFGVLHIIYGLLMFKKYK